MTSSVQFGALIVNKASIAKSGLGQEAANAIEARANQLNNPREGTNPIVELDKAGVDVLVTRSNEANVYENGEDLTGNVRVVFQQRSQFEPNTPKTLHAFDNLFDARDKQGAGFLTRLYEQASEAWNKVSV